jgi:hypothetical protein
LCCGTNWPIPCLLAPSEYPPYLPWDPTVSCVPIHSYQVLTCYCLPTHIPSSLSYVQVSPHYIHLFSQVCCESIGKNLS